MHLRNRVHTEGWRHAKTHLYQGHRTLRQGVALDRLPCFEQQPAGEIGHVERIRRIAEESGYRGSAIARSLATRRTKTIGVVVTTIADLFAAGVVSGIERVAGDHGYSVVLANSNADPDREMRVVRIVRRAARRWHHRHRLTRGGASSSSALADERSDRSAQ